MSEMMYDGEHLIIDHGWPCCPHTYRVLPDDYEMHRERMRQTLADNVPERDATADASRSSDGFAVERDSGYDAGMLAALPEDPK